MIYNFEDLPLSHNLLRGLRLEMELRRPNVLQEEILSMILNPLYKDLVAQAQHSHEIIVYIVLGMLNQVDPPKKIPQAICVCFNRDLVIQIC